VDPIGTVQSWRKIFLVEGIITAGIGVLCIFIIPADPERSRFLTEGERALALKRIAADRVVKNFKREKTSMKLVARAFNINVRYTSSIVPLGLTMCQACICAVSYMLINISFQGLSLFMPTVIATRKSSQSLLSQKMRSEYPHSWTF